MITIYLVFVALVGYCTIRYWCFSTTYGLLEKNRGII